MTMTLINTVAVGAGGQTSIDFTAIPGTYTDLLLVVSARLTSAASEGMFIAFNGSSTGYSARDLYGTGSSAGGSTNPYGITSKLFIGSQASSAQTANTFNSTNVYIANYAASTSKPVLTENVMETNAAAVNMDMLQGLWTGTAAITSLSITSNNGNFVQYTSASLYGITKGTLPGVIVT